MELKVRAKLERKESRGHHYRKDYPMRDDSYLHYITETKGEDGNVVFGKVELPERWTRFERSLHRALPRAAEPA